MVNHRYQRLGSTISENFRVQFGEEVHVNRTLNVLGSGLQHKAGSRWWLKRCWFSKVQEPIENNSCKDCRKLCWWKNRSTSVVTNFSFWIVFVDSCLQFHITLSHIRGTVTDNLVISWKSPESQWPWGKPSYYLLELCEITLRMLVQILRKKTSTFYITFSWPRLSSEICWSYSSLSSSRISSNSLFMWLTQARQYECYRVLAIHGFSGEAWEAHICTGNPYQLSRVCQW